MIMCRVYLPHRPQSQFVCDALLYAGIGSTVASLDAPGTTNILTGVQQVGCGYQFTCALLLNGTVKCWGLNTNGQLGINSTATNTTSPGTAYVMNNATSISVGYASACAINSTGWALCWGSNQFGQVRGNTVSSH